MLGFTNTLLEVFGKKKPTPYCQLYLILMLPTFRHKPFEAYQSKQARTTRDIEVSFIPCVKQIVQAFNIPTLNFDGLRSQMNIIGVHWPKRQKEPALPCS